MQTTERLDILDYLKGFSIFTIAIMHLLQHYPLPNIVLKSLSFGGAGVHVFILCSGFGLGLSYLRKRLSYPQFLKKRFLKIYIPYIPIVFISFLILDTPNKINALFSHILLYKMFLEEFESSFGMQFWFISTIIQFYLFFPLIIRLMQKEKGLYISFFISILWATIVCAMGKTDIRVWNSFFLQYLWEFCLGIFLAKKIFLNQQLTLIPRTKYLLFSAILGISITGLMGMAGGWLKSYNDFFSLIGYLSFALLVYKTIFKNIFNHISKFSYELYLTHILSFEIVWNFFSIKIPLITEFILQIAVALFLAAVYKRIFSFFKKASVEIQ